MPGTGTRWSGRWTRGSPPAPGGTTFSPDRDCTRAEILTFLWRANGSPKAEHLYGVWDVTADKYYFQAVQWARNRTSSSISVILNPTRPAPRAMAVEFLWKAAGSQAIALAESFDDVPMDASYSTAVDWAVIEGITSGTSEDTFSPDLVCTRGQIVTFLHRAYA